MNDRELAHWFINLRTTLETTYLKGNQPWQQSGFGLHSAHGFEHWKALRQPVADAIDRSGRLLDIGCANGYLLECVMGWTAQRGLRVIPHGIDLSGSLIALAKQRLPEFAANFVCGNGWNWSPVHPFDYVRTELVYVPDELRQCYVMRILERYLLPGGRLLAAEYQSRNSARPALRIDVELTRMGLEVERVLTGRWDGVEQTRLAVVKKNDLR